jgi:hypothetical protein
MFNKNKIETISLNEFLQPQRCKEMPRTIKIYSFLPTITAGSFFPIHDPSFVLFIAGSALVTIIALVESSFIRTEMAFISETIENVLHVILPFVGYGLIGWFLLSL